MTELIFESPLIHNKRYFGYFITYFSTAENKKVFVTLCIGCVRILFVIYQRKGN